MDLTVRKISDKKGLKQFVLFPWQIYKNDPYWVPPIISEQMHFLDKKKGVFFEFGEAEYFMAFDGDKPVGRISAHINHQYDKYQQDQSTGFFGFFECINDKQVANALFKEAFAWLKSRGKGRVIGPMSFCVYDEIAMLCDGYDSLPVIMTTYNPPYYNDLCTAAGFTKEVDWYAFLITKDVKIKPAIYKIRDRVMRQPNLRIETLNIKKIDEAVELITPVFRDAWGENWGHVPLTDKQFEYIKNALKFVVIPEITYLAFLDDKCIGFSITIKDANPAIQKANGRLYPFGMFKMMWHLRKVHRARTLLMGVLKEHRHRGIDLVFYLNTVEKGVKIGFDDSEGSVILETNQRMIRALEDLQAKRYKTYRIYQHDIK
jgi:hypothetical protein